MHILIIEDEQQLCQSIAEGLRMDGYEADTCFDGDEGLELCLVENYDLILLDLNLPGVDGLEILRQFRESDTSTPVLILSARGQIQDKVEGLDLGANDYLTKPFHFEELEARIRSLTRRKFIQQDVCLQCGRISFDTRTRKASIDDPKGKFSAGIFPSSSEPYHKPGRNDRAYLGRKRQQSQQFHSCPHFFSSKKTAHCSRL